MLTYPPSHHKSDKKSFGSFSVNTYLKHTYSLININLFYKMYALLVNT